MDKRNIYFIDSYGRYQLLMVDVEEHEAMLAIKAFLESHNFKSYYTRSWDGSEGRWYDVGSHTEFFLWGKHDD